MLRTEGLVLNYKRTYRLYREEGLRVRTKSSKALLFWSRRTGVRNTVTLNTHCRSDWQLR